MELTTKYPNAPKNCPWKTLAQSQAGVHLLKACEEA